MRKGLIPTLTMLGVLAAFVAPAGPAQAAGQAVIVPLDVDVYGVPEDDGTKQPDFLKAGSQVVLIENRGDNWCHVGSGRDPVPGGEGWIWCGPGGDNEDYTLQPAGEENPAGEGEPAEAPEPGGAG